MWYHQVKQIWLSYKDIVNELLERGDGAFYFNNNSPQVACKYRANKDKASGQQKVVYMLSTCHQPSMEIVPNCQDLVYKPACIKAYNSHMGGVDRVDQQLQSLKTLRKTYKWYRKLALRLLSQGILNAHKVYCNYNHRNNVTFLKFMHDTIILLLSSSPKLNKSLVPDDVIHRLTGRHFPAVQKPTEGAKDKHPTKICRVCYARKIRTKKGDPVKTVHICKSCPSQPGLHIENCFEIYHTVLDFAN